MNREEWLRVKALAADALALPQGDRVGYVAARCGSDDSLRQEVLSLLDSAARAVDLFETPPVTWSEALATLVETEDLRDPAVGERIGAYRIVSEIGRGGMGTAYLAARADDAYDKRVAIKLIKRGMDSDAILQRFRRERQILANLAHPNIVTLLDGGTTPDGRPYFVMEYVDGLPIDAFCRERQLPLPERLKLFLPVCAAVQHAHEQHVVHRDLKPSNVLVTNSGMPKLLDFGIAKLLASNDGASTREVTLLAHAMTPKYASPEQVRGEPLTRLSDIYSLGVILYELVTGRPPYLLDDSSARNIERVVCEELPVAPSRIPEAVDAGSTGNRFRLPGKRRPAHDLDAIALTALAKEPSRRYASARALADDVERYLGGLRIATRAPRMRLAPSRRRFAIAASALFVLVGTALAIGSRLIDPDAASTEARSVAVLPFVNVGGYPEVEYLSEGLTEDIINRLTRSPQLKVIARDSAFRYKGAAMDPVQVGRKLKVQSILTGRVVQRGSTLLVSAELVDARDRRQLWGERYMRPLSDLQTLQGELAQQITTSLRVHFPGNDRTTISRTYTRDPGAYEAYLKGRFHWNKRTTAGFKTSVDYFNQAVEKDPQFALAYAGLADAYGLLTEYHAVPATETYGLAKRAALKALAIDPDLPEGRVSLAYIRQFYEWDLEAAEREYRRVLAANPSYSTGHQWYAEFLSAMGRHDEALAEIRQALAVDPLSLIVNSVEANILYMAGQYDRALAKARDVVAMDPNFPEVYEYLKRSYDQRGMYREAIAARQTRRRLLGLDSRETPALTKASSAATQRTYWQKRLEQELEESRTEGVQPFEFAEIYAQAGHTQHALEWLERACDDHDFMTLYAKVAPNLAPLRDEPRYRTIIERGCAVDPAR